MTVQLCKDPAAALHATGDAHVRATDALRRQQDRDAISEGLAQMEAEQGMPLDLAFASIRSRLGFPQAE